MSKMGELVFDIETALIEQNGSFEEIARDLKIPVEWVIDAAERMGLIEPNHRYKVALNAVGESPQ